MVNDICANVQKVIINILIKKTLRAAEKYEVKSILIGGGVAANLTLREEFKTQIAKQGLDIDFCVPERYLCTDNAAMIAASAAFNHKALEWQKVDANPGLYF